MKIWLAVLLVFALPVMASSFDLAIPIVLKHEGLLFSDASDRGGVTKYGISLTYVKLLIKKNPQLLVEIDSNHDNALTGNDIVKLSKAEAINIYKYQWWIPLNFSNINNQKIATKIFDMAVNMGPNEAIELFQESCSAFYKTYFFKIDGTLNKQLVSFVNELNEKESDTLLKMYNKHLEAHYCYLATRHPAYNRFLHGWIKRIYDN